jgi:hypothetical protein
MSRIWSTVKGYIWWTYPRGSVHYDVMVTLILLFIFLSPYFINFNDEPTERTPHPTGVVVFPDNGSLVYQVDAQAVRPGPRPRCGSHDDPAVEDELRRIIEPISGEVSIEGYDEVCDAKNHVIAYRARVRHP